MSENTQNTEDVAKLKEEMKKSLIISKSIELKQEEKEVGGPSASLAHPKKLTKDKTTTSIFPSASKSSKHTVRYTRSHK